MSNELPHRPAMGQWRMAQVPKSVAVTWPVGPHYLRWVEGKGVHAWARYKLKSANWYRAVLAVAVQEAGDLDRYVGIQMALDGVLTSLCAAVDAAGWGLFAAVELIASAPEGGVAEDDDEADVPGDWESVFDLARDRQVALASEAAVIAALEGSGSRSPAGWLAQLRQLRDQAVQHNVLVRRLNVGEELPGRVVDVPGLGPKGPVEYLKSARTEAHELVEALLADIDGLAEQGSSEPDAGSPRRSGPRALPDLSARAGVVRPL
jgi:hypothetical protein